MAKLSSYRRIIKTDYVADNQDLVEKLGSSVNSAFDNILDALNGKLTFGDNILSTVTGFIVSVNSEGVPQQKTQFKLKEGQTSLEGLIVLNVQATNSNTANALGGVGISYARSQNFVNILNVKGLEPNIQYEIKLIALG